MSSVLRISRQQLLSGSRRYASTSTQNAAAQAQAGAAKAKESAAQAAGKAMEILSKSGDNFAKLAAKTGGRTGKVLKTVEAAIPPAIYYSKVTAEVAKLVFQGQKMTPPNMATFKSTFQTLLNPATYSNAFQTVRSATSKDVVFVAVLGAEVLGFFTLGEIIGRRKLIGYRTAEPSHH